MIKLPRKEWDYLFKMADNDLKKTLSFKISGSEVELRIASNSSYDDLDFCYSGIIQDSLDSDDEETHDTYHLEYIWDNFVMNLYPD